MNKIEKKPTYTDTDKMPFGKYKGELLQDIPVDYLHWWYHLKNFTNISLQHYIENNIDFLKSENRDLIWDYKK